MNFSKTQTSSKEFDEQRAKRVTRAIEVFVLDYLKAAGHKVIDSELMKSKGTMYERQLTNLGIKLEDYEAVYDNAVVEHNKHNPNGPFGIDDVVKGAQVFVANKNAPKMFVKEEKVLNTCTSCGGTGLEFEDGKIKYELIDGKKKAVKCNDCKI